MGRNTRCFAQENSELQVPRLKRFLKTDSAYGELLVRGASASFALQLAGLVTGFGLQILLARSLGSEEFGLYVYALTWINVLVILPKLGTDTMLIRFAAAYSAEGNWALLRGLIRFSAVTVFSLGCLVGLSVFSSLWILGELADSAQVRVIWLALPLLPLLALNSARQGLMRGLKRIIPAQLPEAFLRPSILILLVLAGGNLLAGPLTALRTMAMNLVATAVMLAVALVWSRQAVPNEVGFHSPKYLPRVWLSASSFFMILASLKVLFHRTDVLMIGLFLDAQSVGVYSAAARIAELGSLALIAASALLAPLISELHATQDRVALQQSLRFAAKGILLGSLLILGFLLLTGEIILSAFGESFVVGYQPLKLLLIAHFFNALAGPVGFLMSMTGLHKIAAIIASIGLFANASLNYLLIPRFGIDGAALATALSLLIWNGVALFFVWRRTQLNPTVFGRK